MNTRFDLLFMGSLYTLAQNIGPEKAVDQLCDTLENKIRYQEYNKILEKLAKTLNVDLGAYNSEEYKFENEKSLRVALVQQVRLMESSTWQ